MTPIDLFLQFLGQVIHRTISSAAQSLLPHDTAEWLTQRARPATSHEIAFQLLGTLGPPYCSYIASLLMSPGFKGCLAKKSKIIGVALKLAT